MTRLTTRDLLTGSLILMGIIAGGSLSYWSQTVWQSLGKPPGRPQRLQAATQDIVFVQSAEGQVYAYRDQHHSVSSGGAPAGQWSTALPPVADWEVQDCGRAFSVPTLGHPPQPVRDRLSCWSALGQTPDRVGIQYVLLEDASVWRWSTPVGLGSFTGPLSLAILGGLSGLLIGLLGPKWLRSQAA